MIPMHFRSILFAPGNRPDMLHKAAGSAADAIMPDMEDSVRQEDKKGAREQIRQELDRLVATGKPVIPRVNSLPTGLTAEDMAAVMHEKVALVSIGKISSVEDVLEVDRLLCEAEKRAGIRVGHTGLLPWLETAKALLHPEAVLAASPRIRVCAFGADDFAADMGFVRSSDLRQTQWVKSHVAVAARATGVWVMDSPCIQFRELSLLHGEIEEARMLGFRGKFAIHPAQLDVINRGFCPHPQEVARAQAILEAWNRAPRGRGALNLEGVMVDEPLIRQCLQIVAQAERFVVK
ncbi:MAG: CoA ester lyase [Pseudomonadota bacterium]|nr:CoA ester lyase [Pseudomonadota bacterium]